MSPPSNESNSLLDQDASALEKVLGPRQQVPPKRNTTNQNENHQIHKSPSDDREYRGLVLGNNLRVLLVSEPMTDKAAAALTVGVGSLNNPDELLGLAHFCEHMIFLGTEKYKEENDFEKYLTDNGGSTNAYTDYDQTNYHFDVSPTALRGALDRFSQFFTSPLFTESCSEREVKAVDSEHDKNIPDDAWRAQRILEVTSSPSHPYSRFASGNLQTLWAAPKEKSIDIRSALMNYYYTHYSSNIMRLSILGSESLDELQQMVTELFSEIQNKSVDLPFWKGPCGSVELQRLVNVVPIKELREMSIVFEVPDMSLFYKSGPIEYITHLIGHEGEGSLLSLLKEKNWVTELASDHETPGRGFGTLSIELELTPAGFRNKDEVLVHVFQYLEMLKIVGPQEWFWEELKEVQAFSFRFKDKDIPMSYVTYLVERMLKYPMEDVLSAGYVFTEYKPELITRILELLTVENCRVLVTSTKNKPLATLKEEYYGIDYSVEKIDEGLVEKLRNCGVHESLKLPPRNEFIPTCFDLKPREDQGIIPDVIVNNGMSRAFFLQDNEFLLPKAVVRVEIFSVLPCLQPKYFALNHLLKLVLEDGLTEFAYAANIAGLQYKIQDSYCGLNLIVGGYEHKLERLFQKIVERVVDFQVQPERFEVLKEFYMREMSNWEKEQPSKHATFYLRFLLNSKCWKAEEVLESLKDLNVEDLTQYASEFIKHIKLEWLLYGNLTEEDSKGLVQRSQSIFESRGSKPLSASEAKRIQELKLQPGADFVFKSEHLHHSDCCTNVYFQAGLQNTRTNVLVELLDQIAAERAFDQLRTKEALGYIVYTDVRKAHGSIGLEILVQSSFHPTHVEERVDLFLGNLYKTLKEMTEEEFLQNQSALATRKSEKPKTIWERAKLLWDEIISQQFHFTRQEVELKDLATVTLPEVQEQYESLIGPPAAKRRRLSVHIVSVKGKSNGKSGKQKRSVQESTDAADEVPPALKVERNSQFISSAEEWRSGHEFFPYPEPQMHYPQPQ